MHQRPAQQNRARSDLQNPVWAYKIDEVAPEIGDIVVKARSQRNRATWYDLEGKPTHGDIVVGIQPSHLEVIGGNVSNSVDKTHVKISGDGKIATTDHFAVVKIRTDLG
jgi:hypothetical protein